MRKYISILVLAAAAIGVFSCTGKFDEFNRNPDQPSHMDLDVWDYIKNMQYTVISNVKNEYKVVENVSGGAYGRYFAYAQSSNKNWYTNGIFAFYRIATNWHNPMFEVPMTGIYSNWRAIQEALDDPEDDYRMAIAQILRVAAMQRLADVQGPIPYRTMENSNAITAAYEAQEDVYVYMIDDLTDAVTALEKYISLSGLTVIEEAKDRDYVYNANLTKWIKFGNSLKLRLAMRISGVATDIARDAAQEAVSHVYGVITSNDDNASVDFSSANDNNPLWWMIYSYEDAVAAAEIVTYMKSYNDPRIGSYFNASSRANTEYHGSRVGVNSTLNTREYYSLPKAETGDRVMWLNAAEVAFMKAEMALNNWTVDGTSQENYELGIKLSMEQYGITGSGYTNYIASTTAPANYADPRSANSYTPSTAYSVTVAWTNNGSTDPLKLEKIITQKWIAMYPLGTEAWSEQRRTGYPRFYPTPTATNQSGELNLPAKGPSRIPFAPNEVTRNENYDAAVTLLNTETSGTVTGDKFGTKLWWDTKTDKPTW